MVRHLLTLFIFLFGTASTVDKVNADNIKDLEIANKVISKGTQIFKPERLGRSYWVYENEIYMCQTGLSRIPETKGNFRPSISCISQISIGKMYYSDDKFEKFKTLNDYAMGVFYTTKSEPFSQIEHEGYLYTFHMTFGRIYICTDAVFSLVLCRRNTDQKGFDDLILP